MDEMREIVTMEQANGLFLALAVVIPILGILVGAAIGARQGRVRAVALRGFLIGLVGPLNLLLWMVYNLITDRLGLDTVKNLLVNLALFAALGVIGGLIAGRWSRRSAEQAVEQTAPPVDSGTPERPSA